MSKSKIKSALWPLKNLQSYSSSYGYAMTQSALPKALSSTNSTYVDHSENPTDRSFLQADRLLWQPFNKRNHEPPIIISTHWSPNNWGISRYLRSPITCCCTRCCWSRFRHDVSRLQSNIYIYSSCKSFSRISRFHGTVWLYQQTRQEIPWWCVPPFPGTGDQCKAPQRLAQLIWEKNNACDTASFQALPSWCRLKIKAEVEPHQKIPLLKRRCGSGSNRCKRKVPLLKMYKIWILRIYTVLLELCFGRCQTSHASWIVLINTTISRCGIDYFLIQLLIAQQTQQHSRRN